VFLLGVSKRGIFILNKPALRLSIVFTIFILFGMLLGWGIRGFATQSQAKECELYCVGRVAATAHNLYSALPALHRGNSTAFREFAKKVGDQFSIDVHQSLLILDGLGFISGRFLPVGETVGAQFVFSEREETIISLLVVQVADQSQERSMIRTIDDIQVMLRRHDKIVLALAGKRV
jgi:hypothetical protein